MDGPVYHEVGHDPPVAKVGPREVAASAFPPRAARAPFWSVQVNTDPKGNNILGDAANEPSIAIDPTDPNKMAIGWRQFDSIESDFRQAGYAYSRDGGRSWTFPGVLAPGEFQSDPVLDFDADGNFYYYAMERGLAGDLFISLDGGVSWLPPVRAAWGDKPWMAIDRTDGIGRGNIYVAVGAVLYRSMDGGGTFDWHRLKPSPRWPVLTVAPDGTVFVVGPAYPTAAVIRSRDAKSARQPTFERLDVDGVDNGY